MSDTRPPVIIYADPPRPCVKNGRWKWDRASHLFALPGDDPARALRALFLAAASVGLRREWFQAARIDFPHFDLAPAAYDRGIKSAMFTACDLKQTIAATEDWRATIAAGRWSAAMLETFLKS